MLGIQIYVKHAMIETVENLFIHCMLNKFCNDALSWMQRKLPVKLILFWEFVKFGLLIKDKKLSFVNVLLLLKFYIHKCIVQNSSTVIG